MCYAERFYKVDDDEQEISILTRLKEASQVFAYTNNGEEKPDEKMLEEKGVGKIKRR